jgi:hypothetical protein
MDEDLADLDREALVAEVKRLRDGITQHRASSDHDLCWYHPELWNLLLENTDSRPTVPAWPQLLRGCLKYRESLDRQLLGGPDGRAAPGGPPNSDIMFGRTGRRCESLGAWKWE